MAKKIMYIAPAMVSTSIMAEVVNPPAFTWVAMNQAGLAGGLGGAAAGGVVGLMGTPAITVATLSGGVAGYVGGSVAYAVMSLMG